MFEPQEGTRRTKETPKIEYDAEKIERLKATIIKSLKHTANIRAVQPNESVVVTITGGDATGSKTVTRTMVIQGRGRNSAIQTASGSDSADIEMSPPTKIVIRVKKTDIDAIANEQIDMDQFIGRVQIIDCPYLSSDLTSQISTTSKRGKVVTTPGRGRSSGSSLGDMYGEQR
jgi:nitrogen regulatory protein PII